MHFTGVSYRDMPRIIQLTYKGKRYLLHSKLQELPDKFDNAYKVYELNLPEDEFLNLPESKIRFLYGPRPCDRLIGRIPIASVPFDWDCIDALVVEELLTGKTDEINKSRLE